MSVTITQTKTLDLFPELEEFPLMPDILYVRGIVPTDGVRIGIVGSRNLTSYGHDITNKIVAGLAAYPAVIVSGLAYGIDITAHRAALDAKLPTIAIPGSGLAPSKIHPQAHVATSEEIIRSGGALISPFPPETQGAFWTFPVRNKLIAALCDMIIVVEAQAKSGSLITAHCALEYNKRLGAVPGSVFSPNSFGTNNLLKQGATVVCDAIDIAREIGWTIPEIKQPLSDLILTEVEEKVMRILATPTTRNDIATRMNLPITEIGITLSILEMKGYIAEEMGLVRRTV